MTDPTIEELCRPLSAKVMPRSAMYGLDHREITQGAARRKQRQSVPVVKKKGVRAGQDRGKSQPAERE